MPFHSLRIWAAGTNLRVKNFFSRSPSQELLKNHTTCCCVPILPQSTGNVTYSLHLPLPLYTYFCAERIFNRFGATYSAASHILLQRTAHGSDSGRQLLQIAAHLLRQSCLIQVYPEDLLHLKHFGYMHLHILIRF